jgi:hypothetical protein
MRAGKLKKSKDDDRRIRLTEILSRQFVIISGINARYINANLNPGTQN